MQKNGVSTLVLSRKANMLKQEILTTSAIINLIDYLVVKNYKCISLNFCYIDDDETPSINLIGTGGNLSEGEINQIFLHPEISKRESLAYFPFINSCFNIAKKINFSGLKEKSFFSLSFQNQNNVNPYLDYKKISYKDDNRIQINENHIFIQFKNLEEINLNNQIIKHQRKPHIAFFNLMNDVKTKISLKYFKLLKEGFKFSISTKSTSQFIQNPFQNLIDAESPFQEEDPQCHELETREKNFDNLNVKVKPFLISLENNKNIDENSTHHGIHFMHEGKIIYFDQWNLCSIKLKRIFAKDPNKLLRIRVLLGGDINFGKNFSINPINGKITISNSLIKLIESQIEVSLSHSFSLIQNINLEENIELQNIAKSDALAAFNELVYSQKYDKSSAIKKICESSEMVKFDFIEDYLKDLNT